MKDITPILVGVSLALLVVITISVVTLACTPQEPEFNLNEIRRSACLSRDGFVYLQKEGLCVVGMDLRNNPGKTIHQSVREFVPPVGSVTELKQSFQ